jgi:mannose-1-phosphate guanylyltransferase
VRRDGRFCQLLLWFDVARASVKAYLLAAGLGTRLRPLTDNVPKCLIPIQGVPLLEIWLALCRRFGIHELLINTHAHATAVNDFVRRHRNGVRVTVVEELAFHRTRNTAATIGVYEVPDPERCGIVTLDADNRLQDFTEKPSSPRSNLAFSGLMLATPELIDAIPAKLHADIGYDLLPKLTGKVYAYRIPEYVIDIGTLQNYHAAQRDWVGL